MTYDLAGTAKNAQGIEMDAFRVTFNRTMPVFREQHASLPNLGLLVPEVNYTALNRMRLDTKFVRRAVREWAEVSFMFKKASG